MRLKTWGLFFKCFADDSHAEAIEQRWRTGDAKLASITVNPLGSISMCFLESKRAAIQYRLTALCELFNQRSITIWHGLGDALKCSIVLKRRQLWAQS